MRVFILFALSCVLAHLPAQGEYFQQDLAYDIDVRLDDRRHELHGNLRLTYTNNSPDTLGRIYYHLWPNAYAGKNSAYAQQKLRNGSTRFHFSDPADGGAIDSLNWTDAATGISLLSAYEGDHRDVAYLVLPTGLAPGQTITLATPFRVKIPKSFSRLGRVGESYQITQWYPKPAVYDRAGWHPMPYLDLGEYYGEFATYDVKLTLPANYTIGATGVLQTTGEHAVAGRAETDRLLAKAAADRRDLKQKAATLELSEGYVYEPFPPSAPTTKTLHYHAERVHDFAWFADKRFKVLHDTLQLAGRVDPVDVWALFNDTEAAYWKDATDYLKNATRFYSREVGTYPYPQVTGLQSALSVGGGMEYPMVTVIGRNGSARDLDEVLAHEVGHNWFYGILASNERDHAWMDEGLNSYYEQRYMAAFYPDYRPEFFDLPVDIDRLGYHYTARTGSDQPPSTRADSLSEYNYWIEAYSKPVLLLNKLEAEVGRPVIDRIMRTYYERWSFRHPRPADFFAVAAEFLTPEQTDYLRTGFLTDEPLDFRPARRADEPAVRLGLLTGQESGATRLFALPLLGFNEHDGPLLGAALHNRTLEPRTLEWAVAPLYGFESKTVTGFAGLRYRRAMKGTRLRQLVGDLGYQRFSDFTLQRNDAPFQYQRVGAKLDFQIAHDPITELASGIRLRATHLERTRPAFDDEGTLAGDRAEDDTFLRLTYYRGKDRELRPTGWRTTLEYYRPGTETAFRQPHLRLEGEYTGGFQYEAGRFLRYRAFGGYFLSNDLRDGASRTPTAFHLVDNAATDYRYDDLYLGRNLGGIYEQQLGLRQGGFRAPIGNGQSFGRSNNYLLAFNLDARLPAVPTALPLGVYLDAGYYGFRATTSEPESGTLSWVGGVSLTALQGRVGVYAPLLADPDTRMLLEQRGNLLDRLVFRLNLGGLLPWKWVDGLL